MFPCPTEIASEVITILNILFPQSEFIYINKTYSSNEYSVFGKAPNGKYDLPLYKKFQYHIETQLINDCDYHSFSKYLINTPIKELKTIKYLIERGI